MSHLAVNHLHNCLCILFVVLFRFALFAIVITVHQELLLRPIVLSPVVAHIVVIIISLLLHLCTIILWVLLLGLFGDWTRIGLGIVRESRIETHPFIVIAHHSKWGWWASMPVIVSGLRYKHGCAGRFLRQSLTLMRLVLIILVSSHLNVLILTLFKSLPIHINLRTLAFLGYMLRWLSLARGILVAGIAAL